MGYSERCCQLCGVPFHIARIRRHDEPHEAAWDIFGHDFVYVYAEASCPAEAGCSDEPRGNSMGSVGAEHIAGPGCELEIGYSGWRIGVEEMKGRTTAQFLAPKLSDWCPEPDDEQFEIESKHCFLSGISNNIDEWEAFNLQPVRHGLSETMIDNQHRESEEAQAAMPFHPDCFDMYKRLSVERFGFVDIDGLWELRTKSFDFDVHRFNGLEESPDIKAVKDQDHVHINGTEYLASNPIEIPALRQLIEECTTRASDFVFNSPHQAAPETDIFSTLPIELIQTILHQLSSKDVANLRLSSRVFRQLPQTFFRHLITTEMPWVWELANLTKHARIDWFRLWTSLAAADGASALDEQQREYEIDYYTHCSNKVWATIDVRAESQEQIQEKFRKEADEPAEEHFQALRRQGKWTAKRKLREIRGLRNRRRIYGDVGKILGLIEGMRRDCAVAE